MINAPGARSMAARLAAVAALLLLAACAGAPVQEMSDARQAIQAAEEAGAREHAPGAFSDAQKLLSSAEQKLQIRAYSGARHDAREARRRAAEALRASRVEEN